MQKKYVAPELKLAGEADNVVLGGGSGGGDFFGEDFNVDMDFLPDEDIPNAC